MNYDRIGFCIIAIHLFPMKLDIYVLGKCDVLTLHLPGGILLWRKELILWQQLM